jgi:hypothetical protein
MFDKEMKYHIRETLIGLHIQDANILCADKKWHWRIVRDNSEVHVVTSTMSLTNIGIVNLELNDGIVTFIDFS